MSRAFRVLALAAMLALQPGCFVLDELDNGMELMDEVSAGGAKRKAAAEAAEAEADAEGAAPKRPGPSTRAELAKWWKSARTPASGPKDPATASAIVTCRIGGTTRFMDKTDCEIQGGTF